MSNSSIFDSLPQPPPWEFRTADEKRLHSEIKAGSEDARVTLTMNNIAEAFLYVKKCCKAKIADDEIVSLCYKTLYRNAIRFTPGKIRFFAFTKVALRGAISDHWTELNSVRNAHKHQSEPAPHRPKVVHYWQSSSMATARNTGGDEVNYLDVNAMRPEKISEPEFGLIDIREKLAIVRRVADKKLTAQERMILDLVYTSGFTFEQIGELLGVTGSAAERTHSTAMKKLRREFRNSGQLL